MFDFIYEFYNDYLICYWTLFLNSFYYFYSIDYTFFFSIKLTLCIFFLILLRGGVPRYRYDFLTKIGWIKFLGFILSLFLVSVILFLLW